MPIPVQEGGRTAGQRWTAEVEQLSAVRRECMRAAKLFAAREDPARRMDAMVVHEHHRQGGNDSVEAGGAPPPEGPGC